MLDSWKEARLTFQINILWHFFIDGLASQTFFCLSSSLELRHPLLLALSLSISSFREIKHRMRRRICDNMWRIRQSTESVGRLSSRLVSRCPRRGHLQL